MSSWFHSSPHTNSEHRDKVQKMKETIDPTSDKNVNNMNKETQGTGRRASHGSGGFGGYVPFSSLEAMKRDPSGSSARRRSSVDDQSLRTGFGKMFNNWVRGPPTGPQTGGTAAGNAADKK